MKIKLNEMNLKERTYPHRVHANDAGADVYLPFDIAIKPQEVKKIPLGFGVEIPDGCVGFVFPRSSLAAKGLCCELAPIDSGYLGEIHAILSNVGNMTHVLKKGERVGQLVVLPVVIADFVKDLGKERKDGAFGSTGK